MPILRPLLWYAAKRLAMDPRARRMAVQTYHKMRPRLDATIRQACDVAREAPPLHDPRGFVRSLRERMLKKG